MDPKHKGAQAPPEARVLLWEGEPVLSFFPPKVTLPLGMPKRVTAYYRRLEQMWRDRRRHSPGAVGSGRNRRRPALRPESGGAVAAAQRDSRNRGQRSREKTPGGSGVNLLIFFVPLPCPTGKTGI